MEPVRTITDEEIAAEVDPCKGNVSAIARKLKVSRTTVYNRINANAELQSMLMDARESMLDNAETKLYSKALDGDTTSLIFFLKTQGKRRGYTERTELTGVDGGAVKTEGTMHTTLDVKGLTDDELAALYGIATKLLGSTGDADDDRDGAGTAEA